MPILKLSAAPSPLEMADKVNEIIEKAPASTTTVLTHTKEGATHTLTGEAPVQGVYFLLFTASADYETDDTLLVNGEAYEIKTPWGKRLPARAWVAGAVVSANVDTEVKTIWFALSSANTTIIEGGRPGMLQNNVTRNFPLTIQLEEPEPICDGHIWLAANIYEQISRVYIDTAIRVSHPDGSIIFVVKDNDNTFEMIKEVKTLRGADGAEKDITLVDTIHPGNRETMAWQAGLNVDTNEVRKSVPLIYSRLNGVLDIETAYRYDGVTRAWVKISQKGSYLFHLPQPGTTVTPFVYEWRGEGGFTQNQNITQVSSGIICARPSLDGTMLVVMTMQAPYLTLYRREGNVFTAFDVSGFSGNEITPVQAPDAYYGAIPVGQRLDFSPDGKQLAVALKSGVEVYGLTENGLVLQHTLINMTTVTGVKYAPDNGRLFVYTTNSNPLLYWYDIAGGGFTYKGYVSLQTLTDGANKYIRNTIKTIDVSPDSQYLLVGSASDTSSSPSYYGNAGLFRLKGGEVTAENGIEMAAYIAEIKSYQFTSGSNTLYYPGNIPRISFSHNGKYILYAGSHTNITSAPGQSKIYARYFNGGLCGNEAVLLPLPGVSVCLNHFALSPDSQYLYSPAGNILCKLTDNGDTLTAEQIPVEGITSANASSSWGAAEFYPSPISLLN